MKELIAIIKTDATKKLLRSRGIPVIVEPHDEDINLFKSTGPIQIAEYWYGEKRLLEDALKRPDDEVVSAVHEVREDLALFGELGANVTKLLRTMTGSTYVVKFAEQQSDGFRGVITSVRNIADETLQGAMPASRSSPTEKARAAKHLANNSEASPEIARLQDLAKSIRVPSENDPDQPEFPPFSPRFPATPSYEIYIPRLERNILVKDESYNFTGSHKDRMAWEIVVYYKQLIEERLEPHSKTFELPVPSIISNGSAAFAIQVMLRCFGLPQLRVLVDQKTFPPIIKKLESVGCKVFKYDLKDRELDSDAVLTATDNIDGFDITARSLVDPDRRKYYDWLAYEILNCEARHIFIPVGTGDLYVNVLRVLRDELLGETDDPRLRGGSETIEGLEVYGATSSDRKTKMNKLWAPFRPTLAEAEDYVAKMVKEGLIGKGSKIYDVGEANVPEAVRTARAGDVHCDESGIAGLSLLTQLSYRRKFPPGDKILVVNTGWLPLT